MRLGGGQVYRHIMESDPLEDMPAESLRWLVSEVQAVLDVDEAGAQDVIRSAEPFWGALERAGGMVDSWGGGEFCELLPRVLTFIRGSG